MNDFQVPKKEGDLYKRMRVGQYTFELRYGYYTESDRAFGEPAVIFPDLSESRLYGEDGALIVTAIQDPCVFYEASDPKIKEGSCIDCTHFFPPAMTWASANASEITKAQPNERFY